LAQYQDVAEGGADPLWHYAKYGYYEGRMPSEEHRKYIDDFLCFWRDTPAVKSVDKEWLQAVWQFYQGKDHRIRQARKYLEVGGLFDRKIDRSTFAEYLFYAELLIINREYEEAVFFLVRQRKLTSNDLRVNDSLARAKLLLEDDSRLSEEPTFGFNPYGNLFCLAPFESLTVDGNQKVACCCAHWTNTTFGSIGTGKLADRWESDIADKFRQSVASGAFEYCDKLACPKLRNRELPRRSIQIVKKYVGSAHTCKPKNITLSQDATCNLTCPSCRSERVTSEKNVLKNFEEVIFPELLTGEIENLHIAGFGDPFASPHYRRLLGSIDPIEHHVRRLYILTNGLLLNEKMWTNFTRLESLPYLGIGISIDAATPDTYMKLRRGGDWETLVENLRFVRKLRKNERIDHLTFAFVLQAENIQELPEFIDMADEFGADHVRLNYLHPGGELSTNVAYQQAAIHLPSHPRHGEYLQVLEHPIMDRDNLLFM
jgi:hypothetical protein